MLQGRSSDWGVGPQPVEGAHNVVDLRRLDTGPRGHLFFGYQATNRCCREWLLLGWPSRADGRPKHLDATRDPVVGVPCPKCSGTIYFDLAHWDICNEVDVPDEAQPPVIVGGRLRVG